jgi:hypothetical protein
MPTMNRLGPKRASLQKYSTNVAPMRGAYSNARKAVPSLLHGSPAEALSSIPCAAYRSHRYDQRHNMRTDGPSCSKRFLRDTTLLRSNH